MNKKIITLAVSAVVALTAFSNAQQITFRADMGAIDIGGTILTGDTEAEARQLTRSLDVSGFAFFVPAASFDEFVGADLSGVYDAERNTIDVAALPQIVSFLSGVPGFTLDNVVGSPPDFAPDGAGVLNATFNAGAAGFHPVFLIHDSATGVDGLGLGSHIGLVTSTHATRALGTDVVTFTGPGAANWDRFLIGKEGSIELATVIPEPRVYAALFGLFALGFVMWRRRNR